MELYVFNEIESSTFISWPLEREQVAKGVPTVIATPNSILNTVIYFRHNSTSILCC